MRLGICTALTAVLLVSCAASEQDAPAGDSTQEYYGTLEPFAAEAVYFVITDRFVDGDASNNHQEQGGEERGTFDRPIQHPDDDTGNIGYRGGDFRGIVDNADYIAEMGFSAVWITPIVDNPDEAFTGGFALGESIFADRGKTGYHGYWGVNFFAVDEHLESASLTFADFTHKLRTEHGLRTVLDIVCNHGSPAYTMPEDQPMFGEIYGRDGMLLADHQNLHPSELDPANPLHRFFHPEPDLAQLSNLNDTNPDVLEYFVAAYLHWIGQGADAFRIDTIKHMPHAYWKRFGDRIRTVHPGFFMFGESFDYDAAKIAEHTYPENGGIRVLDFPGRQRMNDVFAGAADYREIVDYLHLTDGVYQNPYELMTFYDNHDMPRMNASPEGFIDAHNWLFTSRGIPVVYYGSEIAFRAGTAEHGGNRDYFGQDNVESARNHPIRKSLAAIASIRRVSSALQRGLQANLEFGDDTATFYRVYQKNGDNQTALVLLNKGAEAVVIDVDRWLSHGTWRDAASGESLTVPEVDPELTVTVPPHGVRVFLFDEPNNNPALAEVLVRLQAGAHTRLP